MEWIYNMKDDSIWYLKNLIKSRIRCLKDTISILTLWGSSKANYSHYCGRKIEILILNNMRSKKNLFMIIIIILTTTKSTIALNKQLSFNKVTKCHLWKNNILNFGGKYYWGVYRLKLYTNVDSKCCFRKL